MFSQLVNTAAVGAVVELAFNRNSSVTGYSMVCLKHFAGKMRGITNCQWSKVVKESQAIKELLQHTRCQD